MKTEHDLPFSPHGELACADARVLASAWTDGELEDQRALRAHLERCAPCQAHAAELRELQGRWKPLRRPEPAPDLWPGIVDCLRAPRPKVRRWPGASRATALTRAAAALVGFAGTAVFLRAPDPNPAPATGWAAALRANSPELERLGAAPERLLLASLAPSLPEPLPRRADR